MPVRLSGAHDPPDRDAHAYFALAVKLAKDAGGGVLLARALYSESVLHFPTAGGDPRTALRLLNHRPPPLTH